MPRDDIVRLAHACRKVFTELSKHKSISTDVHDWLEVQAARLNLWSDSLGIYARDELSVIYRLSENESIALILTHQLDGLEFNLGHLRRELTGVESSADPLCGNADVSDSGSSSASEDEGGVMSRLQKRIEDGLRRLTYVAIKIRREGKSRVAARAAEFEPLNDEGQPLKAEFQAHIDFTLRRAFGDISMSHQSAQSATFIEFQSHDAQQSENEQYQPPNYLLERLKITMLDRWRRICYQMHHAKNLTTSSDPEVAVREEPNIVAKTAVAEVRQNHNTQMDIIDERASQVIINRTPNTVATKLRADYVVPDPDEVATNVSGTIITSARAVKLDFPTAPKIQRGTDVFACPLCGLLQPANLLQRSKWHTHVMQDLSPYICIFRNCNQPLSTFATSDAWVEHNKAKHSRSMWRCNVCPTSSNSSFTDSVVYEQHLTEYHGDSGINAQQLHALVSLGRLNTPLKHLCCPFCGFVPENLQVESESDDGQRIISDHMYKDHMQPLALKCLPWNVLGAGEDSDYHFSHDSHTDSEGIKRVIMLDEDLKPPSYFDEFETQKLANDPELQTLLNSPPRLSNVSFVDIKLDFDLKLRITSHDSVEQWILNSSRKLTENDHMYSRIVDWISPADPWVNHQSARHLHLPGTGAWLLQADMYQAWKSNSTVRNLWLYGKPGCGKTVLCSTVIEDIRAYRATLTTIGQAIFYFSFSDLSKQTYEDLIRSMVIQLGSREPGLSLLVEAYENAKQNRLGPFELYNILLTISLAYDTIFLHLDGLDECHDDDDDDDDHLCPITESISRLLQDMPDIKLIATSRDTPIIRRMMTALGTAVFCVDENEVSTDIQQYVSERLAEDTRLLRLSVSTKREIEHTLTNKADGMFRWVYCQLEQLAKSKSFREKNTRAALNALPSTLDETYQQILMNIAKEDYSYASTVLKWVVYTKSPRTLRELSEAAAIQSGKLSVIPPVVAESRERLLWINIYDMLGGLITVQRESDGRTACKVGDDHATTEGIRSEISHISQGTRIRLAHFSIKQYLESTRILESHCADFHLSPVNVHRSIARTCLLYLEYYLNSPLSKRCDNEKDLDTFPLLEYACQAWYYHLGKPGSGVTDFGSALSLLTSDGRRRCWLRVHQPDRPGLKPFEESPPEVLPSSLYYASVCGLDNSVRHLIGSSDINAQNGHFGSPLQAASAFGHLRVVMLLVDCGADINQCGGFWGSALGAASAGDHVTIAKVLLEHGADANRKAGAGVSALHIAATRGHWEVARLLLQWGADVNAQDGHQGSPLLAASLQGHVDAARLLLDHAADSNARTGSQGITPLQAASTGGHIEIVRLLIERGADVNGSDGDDNPPLVAASRRGYVGIVQLLVNHGADPNAQQRIQRTTALQAASMGGQIEIVRLLIEHGADVNAKAGAYGTALQVATQSGHDQVVQLLLKYGAHDKA